jgi:hypothetical protein
MSVLQVSGFSLILEAMEVKFTLIKGRLSVRPLQADGFATKKR